MGTTGEKSVEEGELEGVATGGEVNGQEPLGKGKLEGGAAGGEANGQHFFFLSQPYLQPTLYPQLHLPQRGQTRDRDRGHLTTIPMLPPYC